MFNAAHDTLEGNYKDAAAEYRRLKNELKIYSDLQKFSATNDSDAIMDHIECVVADLTEDVDTARSIMLRHMKKLENSLSV